MVVKTRISDIFKGNDDKWAIRPILAFFATIAFLSAGILDAMAPGVSVDPSFYWACVTLVLGLLAIRALQYVAAIRSGTRVESTKEDQTEKPL